VVSLVVGVVVALGVAASPASAKVIHKEEGSFNGSDQPTHEAFFGLLLSAAADRSSGDVWITELSLHTGAINVSRFNEKGQYVGPQVTGQGTPHGVFASGLFSGMLAVDNTASGPHKGDLYVSDDEHGIVDRFSGSGAFECQITATKPSTTEEQKHECNGAVGSEPTGGPAGMEPSGLAVDSAGDLFVADRRHNVIDKFGPNGEFLAQITSAELGKGSGLGTIAVDSADNLYVTNFEADVIEFDSNGNFTKVINENETASGVAVDPANNNVYVSIVREPPGGASEDAISEYEPSGTLLDTFANKEHTFNYPAGFDGLTVGSSGKVYATEFFKLPGTVFIYSRDLVVPSITTRAATGVEESSATLHGHIDLDAAHGGGEVTSCRFEYGPTKTYGETVPCTPAPPYTGAQDVSANITGLRSSGTYHFRLEAANADSVPGTGEDETFTTSGPPTVDLQSAEALTASVTFKAKIDPWGYDTTCQVQYVNDATFQQSQWATATTIPCSPKDLGSGFGDVTAKFTVRELARATVYHYRFLATNQAGLAGHTSTFETYGIRKLSLEFLKNTKITFPGGYTFWEGGEPEMPRQAGAHPYELVTDVIMSHTTEFSRGETEIVNNTAVNTKDIKVDLPPGLIGNPTALPRCNRYRVQETECPADTEVGVAEIWVDYPLGRGNIVWPLPEEKEGEDIEARFYTIGIYNVEPAGQLPAEFGGFIEGQAPVWIPFEVRSGSDYGVSADAINITDIAGGISRVRTRVWGVPAAPAHEAEREQYCSTAIKLRRQSCPDAQPEVPLLTNPTSCAGPLAVTASIDSWQEPGQYVTKAIEVPGFTGCDKLKFEPSLEAQPTTGVADSPSGLNMDLHVPQDVNKQGFEEPGTLATADLKDAKVVLPAGMVVDPSSADGLAACSEAQIGYLPQKSAEVGHPQFTPEPAECPDASKVGSVEVDSPLVDHPLPGAVYVAAQDANPFKSLLALYITVYDPQTGVVVKLPGKVSLDPVTGQLTTTVDEDPQLPFNDFKLDFFGGSRGALTTPLVCGSYAIGSDLTPWSSPEGADATPSSLPFAVTGPGGGACVSSEAQAPNTPGFTAGTASPVAGSYSPFVLKLSREDGSQRFGALNVTLPPGLTGKIAGIEQCPQAAIEKAQRRSGEGEGALEQSNPSCPSGSAVGVVHVGAGSGAPYYVSGKAYFAGPYEGAPFSLVIVTPAIAGPFDLGTVVVRAGLFINPSTAQVTVKSDPFPTILDGIPLDIRSVAVEMNRSDFVLNPTSCAVMSVTGEEKSTTGNVASLSSRFQAGGCTTLPFSPSFTASTQGRASKASGASLDVKVTSSAGQANIAKVDLQLPKQLSSRLTTLQKACTEKQFAENPAGCPSASNIGSAKVSTPLLSSPLAGPVYLVSHGGAAFPDVEIILQGEGVELILDGKTQIKNGITYSHFETVPDAPFTTFETKLPTGKYSIFGANLPANTKYNFCGQTLLLPTTIAGQNGAVVKQTTKVGVTGCPKVVKKALTRAQKLKAALKVCRTKDKGKTNAKRRKREACEKAAQKRYGPQKKGKKRTAGKKKK
jgi:hypothetical protein